MDLLFFKTIKVNVPHAYPIKIDYVDVCKKKLLERWKF